MPISAPDRPTAHQLEMFGEAGPDADRRTPAMRRWSEVAEDTPASDAGDDAHRSRRGRLARPGHAAPAPRALVRGDEPPAWGAAAWRGLGDVHDDMTIGAPGTPCGRLGDTEETDADVGVDMVQEAEADDEVGGLRRPLAEVLEVHGEGAQVAGFGLEPRLGLLAHGR